MQPLPGVRLHYLHWWKGRLTPARRPEIRRKSQSPRGQYQTTQQMQLIRTHHE